MLVNIKIGNLKNFYGTFLTYTRTENVMVTLCFPVVFLSTQFMAGLFMSMLLQLGEAEADYKHDVISLSILVCISQR